MVLVKEICLIPSSYLFYSKGAFCVRVKALRNDFSTDYYQKPQYPRDIPLFINLKNYVFMYKKAQPNFPSINENPVSNPDFKGLMYF